MKILIAGFMLVVSISLFAGPVFLVEVGPATTDNIYFTDMMAGYRFTAFGITSFTSGGIRTWSYFDDGKGYPFEDIYTLEQRFDYQGFFIRGKHHCAHPVIAQYHNRPINQYWLGDITTISVGYEVEIK
jgi:hypothetical protein